MAVTTIGLVYSTTSWRLRSIVIPDDDTQLAGHPLGQGEAMKIVALADYSAASDVQGLLDGLTGHSPSGDRYISLDASGNVVDIHIADPVGCGDPSPYLDCSLVAHATAARSDLYWNGRLFPNTPMTAHANSLGLHYVLAHPNR